MIQRRSFIAGSVITLGAIALPTVAQTPTPFADAPIPFKVAVWTAECLRWKLKHPPKIETDENAGNDCSICNIHTWTKDWEGLGERANEVSLTFILDHLTHRLPNDRSITFFREFGAPITNAYEYNGIYLTAFIHENTPELVTLRAKFR